MNRKHRLLRDKVDEFQFSRSENVLYEICGLMSLMRSHELKDFFSKVKRNQD